MNKKICICLLLCFMCNIAFAKSDNVLPSVEGLLKIDLQQSLNIEERGGSVVCRGMINCPEFNDSNISINIKNGKIIEINDDYLLVSVFGTEYKVIIKGISLVDYYWGVSDLKSFVLGDIINIFGIFEEDTVYAKSIRNVSLKNLDIYFGKVEKLSSEKLDLENGKSFNINQATRFLSNLKVLNLESIKVGKYVVVRVLNGYVISLSLKDKPSNIPIIKDVYPSIKNSIQTPFSNVVDKIKGLKIFKGYFSK